MAFPTKVVIENAEQFADLDEEFKQVIDRLYKKIPLESDTSIVVDMLESLVVPDDAIMYPDEAVAYNDNGHIRFEIMVYKIEHKV